MLLTINNCFAMKKLPEMIPKVSHKALIPCTTLKKIKKINTEFTDQELKIIGKIIKNNEKLAYKECKIGNAIGASIMGTGFISGATGMTSHLLDYNYPYIIPNYIPVNAYAISLLSIFLGSLVSTAYDQLDYEEELNKKYGITPKIVKQYESFMNNKKLKATLENHKNSSEQL